MAHASGHRITVSVSADLLREARSSRIDIAAVFEDALRKKLAQARPEAWLAENREAFEDANRFIDKYGIWSDGLRRF